MSRTTPAAFLFAAFVAGAPAAQTIQKCVDADGKIAYQDAPCDSKAKSAATIQRDRSTADPLSVQRAQAERARAESYSAARAREYQEEQDRLTRIAEAEARARSEAEAEDRLARKIAAELQPQHPAAVPAQPIVVQDQRTISNRIIIQPAPSAPAPRPQTFSGAAQPAKK